MVEISWLQASVRVSFGATEQPPGEVHENGKHVTGEKDVRIVVDGRSNQAARWLNTARL